MLMPYTVLSTGGKQTASLSFSGCKMEIILECLPSTSDLCEMVHSTRGPNSSRSPNQGVCVLGPEDEAQGLTFLGTYGLISQYV